VPASAFALVLTAAVLHASWNLLLKTSNDRLVAAAVQSAAGALLLAPALVADGYPVERWGSLAVSGALHLGYGLTLIAAYERGDLSDAYPVARGTAPLLVGLGAAVLLDDSPGVWGALGIVLIAGGVFLVARGRPRGMAWALACGGFIAGYSLVDGSAVRTEGGSLRYTAALLLTNTITLGAIALVRRGPRRLLLAARPVNRHLFGGAASAIAYLLVLTAARWAPLGTVAALRETSVVLGALAGWRLLGEPYGASRVVATSIIVIGVSLLLA
jgi:drug/metabolite transporter (DMT)-like permease